MKLLSLVTLIILSGCANHPLDCMVGGAFGALHDDCLPGTAGYKENPHKYRASVDAERHQRANSILTECNAKHEAGEIKTHVGLFQCSDERLTAMYESTKYPYMDLFTLFEAKRLETAELVDKKKLSPIKAKVRLAELQKEWNDEIRKRKMSDMVVNTQYTHQQNEAYSLYLQGLENAKIRPAVVYSTPPAASNVREERIQYIQSQTQIQPVASPLPVPTAGAYTGPIRRACVVRGHGITCN